MTPLRKKMLEDMRLRGLSVATQNHYACLAGVFAKHHGRCPSRLGNPHVRDFMLHLHKLGRANSTRNVYWCALRFLYIVTLEQPKAMVGIPRPRKARRDIVTAPTLNELRALFHTTNRPFDRTLMLVLFGAGLRASEGRNLQACHIDARAGLIHIHHGKGNKARPVPLSPRLLHELRAHWQRYRPPGPWLFPASAMHRDCAAHRPSWKGRPISANAFQRRFAIIRRRATLRRHITPHDLRRAYATNMLEQGVHLRQIQLLLGHTHSKETERYLEVRERQLRRTPCALTLLD